MKVLSAVLLLVGVLVCYTYGQAPEVCSTFPEGTPKDKKDILDLDKFLNVTTWYEVKTSGTPYADGACTTVKYEKIMKEDPKTEVHYVKATYTQYKEKKEGNFTIFLQPKTKNNTYGDSFDVHTSAELNKKRDDLYYQILTTDYDKYAVIYGCNVDKENKKTERMSILSSTTAWADAEQTKVDEILKLVKPSLENQTWSSPEQNTKKCSGASMFGLSTALSAIVAMFLVLRN